MEPRITIGTYVKVIVDPDTKALSETTYEIEDILSIISSKYGTTEVVAKITPKGLSEFGCGTSSRASMDSLVPVDEAGNLLP